MDSIKISDTLWNVVSLNIDEKQQVNFITYNLCQQKECKNEILLREFDGEKITSTTSLKFKYFSKAIFCDGFNYVDSCFTCLDFNNSSKRIFHSTELTKVASNYVFMSEENLYEWSISDDLIKITDSHDKSIFKKNIKEIFSKTAHYAVIFKEGDKFLLEFSDNSLRIFNLNDLSVLGNYTSVGDNYLRFSFRNNRIYILNSNKLYVI